jgi:hypothetical protein
MDQELYRAIFGFVLAQDEAHFQIWPTFSAEPLKERGSAALDTRGIEGLRRATITRLSFRGRDQAEGELEFASDDLTPALDAGPVRALLQERPIGSWTLRLFTAQNPDPRDVHVLPPNQLRVDRGVPFDLLHEFLSARGFERKPPADWQA